MYWHIQAYSRTVGNIEHKVTYDWQDTFPAQTTSQLSKFSIRTATTAELFPPYSNGGSDTSDQKSSLVIALSKCLCVSANNSAVNLQASSIHSWRIFHHYQHHTSLSFIFFVLFLPYLHLIFLQSTKFCDPVLMNMEVANILFEEWSSPIYWMRHLLKNHDWQSLPRDKTVAVRILYWGVWLIISNANSWICRTSQQYSTKYSNPKKTKRKCSRPLIQEWVLIQKIDWLNFKGWVY